MRYARSLCEEFCKACVGLENLEGGISSVVLKKMLCDCHFSVQRGFYHF